MVCKEFIFDQNIVRPADTVAYAIGDLINTAVANTTGLIPLDFTSIGLEPNKKIKITKVAVTSSNGAAATPLVPIVQLYCCPIAVAETVASAGCGDNIAFVPTFAKIQELNMLSFQAITTVIHSTVQKVAGGFYGFKQAMTDERIVLDGTGKLYLALIAGNAYTPISGESFEIKIEGSVQTD